MVDKLEKNKRSQNQFIKSWAMGMNDYEIAKDIGVNVDTIRAVKEDLTQLKDDK